MHRTCLAAIACVLLFATVAAQTRPEFEVASVRPSGEQTSQVTVGLRISGSQVRIGNMTLRDYVGIAYRVRPTQVSGPEWIGQERFDVAAKVPDGVSVDLVPEMLQTLLAERFTLQVHRESKESPVYAIGVAKDGARLQDSAESPDGVERQGAVSVTATGSVAGIHVDRGGGSFFNLSNNRIEIRKMTVAAMADTLTRFFDRPVIDATGLKGTYDLTMDLAPEDYGALMVRSALNAGVTLPPQALRLLDVASGDPLSAPLRKLGLTFEARKAPLDVIVVDAMAKAPTDN